MKKRIKNKLFLVAMVAFLLLSADLICAYLFSDRNTEICCACPDFTKHSGHSHNHTFVDELFQRETNSIRQTEVFNGFIISLNPLFNDGYYSKVWQPPRIS